MGPLHRSGNVFNYHLVYQKLLTKMIAVTPVRNVNAKTIIKEFNDLVINRYEAPDFPLTDKGTKFSKLEMTTYLAFYGIKQTLTLLYHPEGNPVNRTIKTLIRSYIGRDHRDWDKYFPEFRMAYHSAVHSSTHVMPYTPKLWV